MTTPFFAPESQTAFIAAGVELIYKLPIAVAHSFLREFTKWSAAVEAGTATGNEMGYLSAAIFRVIAQHVINGYPLEFPKVVINVYESGRKIEIPLFECELCGYGVPQEFSVCPLCGGRTGNGARSRRMSHAARWN